MSYVKKAVKTADLLKSRLTVGVDINDKIYMSFQYCNIKNGSMLTSFSGRGETAELAALDLLKNTHGCIVNSDSAYHGHKPYYEVNVVSVF